MAGRRHRRAALTGRGADALRRLAPTAALAAALALLPGCAVQKAAQGVPAADLVAIRAGATRAAIESRLGPPLRQWTTPAGIAYRACRYDRGVPGGAMKAMPLVLGEIATLGLLEVIVRAVPDEPTATPGRWRRLAVACGADEVVVGVFNDVDDFVVLPDDGRPRAPAQPAVR